MVKNIVWDELFMLKWETIFLILIYKLLETNQIFNYGIKVRFLLELKGQNIWNILF